MSTYPPPPDFWATVASAHGLLTTRSGIDEFGRSGFYRRVSAGQFEAIHRGVWRVAGSPSTRRQSVMGLTLAVSAVASLRSTLALTNVPAYTLAIPELTRHGYANITRDLGEAKVRIHRSNFMPDHHVTVIDGIPSTTVARALCDVSAVMSLERLSKVVDSCKRMKLVEFDDIATVREELRARGRRRTTYLDQILADRIADWVVGESPPEDVVRKWLEAAGFATVAQHWVVANGRRRRLDIALPDDRVAVEYQGLQEHSTPTAVVNDSEKITDLQLAEWFVVLVTKQTTQAELISNVREAVRRQRERHS